MLTNKNQKRGYIEERVETSEEDDQSVLEYLFPWLPRKNERTDSEETKSENVKNLYGPDVKKKKKKKK
jgi:hypothetical protein